MLFFNFKKVQKQKEELDRIANRIQEIRNSMLGETVGEVRECWQGETAALFLRKCDELAAVIDREVRNIKEIAGSVHQSSLVLRAAEAAAGSKFGS
jgi:uncharacterized protein YukE